MGKDIHLCYAIVFYYAPLWLRALWQPCTGRNSWHVEEALIHAISLGGRQAKIEFLASVRFF